MSCVKSTMNNPGNDYSEAETSALGGENVSMCHFRTSGNLFPYLFYMEEWLHIECIAIVVFSSEEMGGVVLCSL